MGCASSSNKPPSFSYAEECFENRLWISRPKSNCEPSTNDHASPSTTNQSGITETTDVPTICDDIQEVCEKDKSCGYHSDSISTANTSDLSFNSNDCDLKMEMYMMTKISRVMPKTSSPILPSKFPSKHLQQQKDETEDEQQEEQPKRSYYKWKQHLQRTPPYVLNNVTRIPEAIAGQFTPEGFPVYTDVKRCQRGNVRRRPKYIHLHAHILK